MIQLINIDWLSISYLVYDANFDAERGVYLNEVPGFFIEECSSTNIYKNRWIIRNSKGLKVLTILANPHSKIINNRYALIEFANCLFYSDDWKVLFCNLNLFFAGEYYNISRLDLCCDFQEFFNKGWEEREAKYLLDLLDSCVYYVKSKKQGSAFYSYNSENVKVQKEIQQLNYGSKSSFIKWKLYNKTKEINEVSQHKIYIKNLWKDSGFDENKDVFRLECSLTSCSSFSVVENNNSENLLHATKLLKGINVIKLFIFFCENYFTIKVNDGNKNKSRDEIIDIFHFEKNNCKLEKNSSLQQDFNATKSLINKITTSLKEDEILYNAKSRENLLKILADLLDTYCLNAWFFKINGNFFVDYDNKLNELNIKKLQKK